MNSQASSHAYDPNRLFDTLLSRLQLDDDLGLAQVLRLEPGLIAGIRTGQRPVDAVLLIRINEACGINVRELRQWMGDRRVEYRLHETKAQPLVRPRPAANDGIATPRERLRRSAEKDHVGLPNFVQWT